MYLLNPSILRTLLTTKDTYKLTNDTDNVNLLNADSKNYHI